GSRIAETATRSQLSRRPARIYRGEQREGGQPSENGQLVVPDKLGLGLAFDQMAIKDYQICGPSRIGDRLEVPGRLKDLLLARELREVADPLAGLNVLPSDDPFPVDEEV